MDYHDKNIGFISYYQKLLNKVDPEFGSKCRINRSVFQYGEFRASYQLIKLKRYTDIAFITP
jgi:hypothetical protein